MPTTCRALCLLIGVIVGLPALARANETCLWTKELRGNVKTVLISKGKTVAGTATLRTSLHLWERVDISRTRRTVTVTQYSSDGLSLFPILNLWPTTICEFDDAGRQTRVRVKLNGLTTDETVETAYDAQGRPVRKTTRSHNPELTYETTYEYSGNMTTARSSAFGVVAVLTTITERDAAGRTTREIQRRSIDGGELSESSVEYRYGPDTVETLGHSNGQNWRLTRKIDANGNTIEGVTPYTRDTAVLEYDAYGNWIRRVGTTDWNTSRPSRTSDLVVREISYWR
jgi:YD repeat-containing protein